MTHVVTDTCRDCRYTDCVSVCPVDCFHGDARMLYIDPATCIDCGVCVTECPVEAIFHEASLPDELVEWIEVNAKQAPRLPVVKEPTAPLGTAEERARALGFRPL